MPNRKTGLDVSVFNTMTQAYIGDLTDIEVNVNNLVEEGKGIADRDAWPVLVGRETTLRATLQVLSSAGTATMVGSAVSNDPSGTVTLTTGAGTWSGTAVITDMSHKMTRNGITTVDVTMACRGAFPFA